MKLMSSPLRMNSHLYLFPGCWVIQKRVVFTISRDQTIVLHWKLLMITTMSHSILLPTGLIWHVSDLEEASGPKLAVWTLWLQLPPSQHAKSANQFVCPWTWVKTWPLWVERNLTYAPTRLVTYDVYFVSFSRIFSRPDWLDLRNLNRL